MQVTAVTWSLFIVSLIALAGIDLFAFARKKERVSARKAAVWTVVWTGIGAGFALLVLVMSNGERAGEYIAGYLIERSLSLDNVFVFALLFTAMGVPREDQDRPLLIGILGALGLRAIFIVLGAAALDAFHWTVYVFGGLLVVVAIQMIRGGKHHQIDPQRNPLVRMLRGNKTAAVLVAIMTADVIFAVDSIPAIFAVTRDTFIVFAANAFSLLGMRPLYFLLGSAMDRFPYLTYGLAAVLAFVGLKMLLTDVVHIPVYLSLVVIVLLLTTALLPSLLITHRNRAARVPKL
jgi:tellurite resistance protein TerC